MTSVTTSVTGPIGTCVDDGDWSYWGSSAETGSVPFLLAARANKSPAGAGMVKVALVAHGEVSRVLLLGCHRGDGYSSIGSIGVLPLGWCLRCYLPVVVVVAAVAVVVVVVVVVVVAVVAVVVVVVVPELSLMLLPVGFSFWDHCPIPHRLIGHAYSNALYAFVC